MPAGPRKKWIACHPRRRSGVSYGLVLGSTHRRHVRGTAGFCWQGPAWRCIYTSLSAPRHGRGSEAGCRRPHDRTYRCPYNRHARFRWAPRPGIDAILAARRRGYLANLTLNTPQGAGRSLSATLRVPAADLDAALADLRQLGRVESESQKGDDVTRQYADLVARLANARNTEQRLSQILAQRTGKLSDVLDVERENARFRCEI